jgi:hypothetical protein
MGPPGKAELRMYINIMETSIAVEASKEEWMEFIPQLVSAYRSGDFVYAEFLERFRSPQKRETGRSKKKPNLDFYDTRAGEK